MTGFLLEHIKLVTNNNLTIGVKIMKTEYELRVISLGVTGEEEYNEPAGIPRMAVLDYLLSRGMYDKEYFDTTYLVSKDKEGNEIKESLSEVFGYGPHGVGGIVNDNSVEVNKILIKTLYKPAKDSKE